MSASGSAGKTVNETAICAWPNASVAAADHIADNQRPKGCLQREEKSLDLAAGRLPERREPRREIGIGRFDGGGGLAVGAGEFAADQQGDDDECRNGKKHPDGSGHPHQRASPARTPILSASRTLPDSASMTTTVKSPSAMASGIWVKAKMPPNLIIAPATPETGSG